MPEELLDEGNALGMLRAEHVRINSLMGNVFERDEAFARQALIELLQKLQIHNAMERRVFFPLCEAELGATAPERIAEGTRFNMALEELCGRLENMDVTDPEFRTTFENLIHSFQSHCYAVEEDLFIALEGRDWSMHNKLAACAIDMRSLRSQMLASSWKRGEGTAEVAEFQEMQQERAQEQGRREWAPRDVVSDDQGASEEGSAGV